MEFMKIFVLSAVIAGLFSPTVECSKCQKYRTVNDCPAPYITCDSYCQWAEKDSAWEGTCYPQHICHCCRSGRS